MLKKSLIFIVCMIVCLNLRPSSGVFASSLSAETITKIEKSKAYNGTVFDDKLLLNSDVKISEIESFLLRNNPPTTGNFKYKLNPYVYQKYKIVAYTNEEAYDNEIAGLTVKGSPMKVTQTVINDDFTSQTKSFDEYRYLGYQENGRTEITNDFYPADSKTVSDPRTRTWIYNDPKKVSWNEKVLEDRNALNYYLNSKVQNDDKIGGVFEQTDYSIADITKESNLDTLAKFPKIMSDATFSSSAVLNMVHSSGGKQWYDTMRLKQYNYDLSTLIDNVVTDVKLPLGTETYEITYDVITGINNIETDGLSKDGKYFRKIKLDGMDVPLFHNEKLENRDLPNLEVSLTKEVDLKGMKVNEVRTIKLCATSSVDTFDGGSRTHYAEPVTVMITLVDNDLVDFNINKNMTDITDSPVIVKDLLFTSPLTVTLDDSSFIQSAAVTERVWKVDTPTGEVTISGGNLDSVDFTLSTANRNYVMDGKVKFILYLSTADGFVGSASHFFNPLEKSTTPSSSDLVAVIEGDADLDPDDDERYLVMEGEEIRYDGNDSYHKADLEITDYIFDIGEDAIQTDSGKRSISCFYPDSDGGHTFRAYLEVIDENDESDTDYARTKVVPARFEPKIEITGTFKENRKLSFEVKNDAGRLEYYPIDEDSLIWSFIPLDGQSESINVEGSSNGSISFDGQFKLKGRYKVTVEGNIHSHYNTNIYRGSAERIINISEDVPPQTDFVSYRKTYRDIMNGLVTKIYAYDLSESVDNDIIIQRIWSYYFDSDNDGDFEDETRVVFHAGNERQVYFETDHVGNYLIELTAKEEFGQATITRFISDSDKRRGDTSAKTVEEKITEIDNVAPIIQMEVTPNKRVNLIVYEDLDDVEMMSINTEIDELRVNLIEKKIDLNVEYITPETIVGTFTDYLRSWYRLLTVRVEVEDRMDDDDWTMVNNSALIDEVFELDSEYYKVPRVDTIQSPVNFSYASGGSYYYKNKEKVYYYYFDYMWLRASLFDASSNSVINSYKIPFVTRQETRRGSDWGFNYDEVYLDQASLYVSDQYITGVESYGNKDFRLVDPYTDNTFKLPIYFKVGDSTKKNKSVKLPSTDKIRDLLSSFAGEDTYFINVCKDNANRLGFNEEFYSLLSENNVIYRTVEDKAQSSNPLKGFDNIEIKNLGLQAEADLYAEADGNLFRLLDTDNDEDDVEMAFLNLGNKEDANYNGKSFMDFYSKGSSIYSKGYKAKDGRDYIGMEALEEWFDDKSYDYYSYRDEFRGTYEDVRDHFNNESNYSKRQRIGKIDPLYVEDDGSLIGVAYDCEMNGSYSSTKRYYKFENIRPIIKGSGYIKRFGVMSDDPLGTSRGTTNRIWGYIHSNGNIYYKKITYTTSGQSVQNYLTVTEGIDNIDRTYTDDLKTILYVVTKDKRLIKYDFIKRRKTVLLESFISCKGNLFKISENRFYLNGIYYDDVIDVYSVESAHTWNKKQRKYYYSVMEYKIDLNGVYTKTTKSYSYESGKNPKLDNEWVRYIGQNAKELPAIYLLDKGVRVDYAGRYLTNGGRTGYYREYYTLEESPSNTTMESNPVVKMLATSYTNHQITFASLYKDGSVRFNHNLYKYGSVNQDIRDNLINELNLLAASPFSAFYDTNELMFESIYEDYKNYSTSDTLTILVDEIVNTKMIMQDVEDDPAYKIVMTTEHVDPNYFENSLGRDPNVGEGKIISQFKYVGHYKMTSKAQDNPVGTEEAFAPYRYWNKDNTFVDVFVHRRPIAFFTTSIAKDDNGKMTLYGKDNGSYDLDHESQVNKGIIKWEWSLKAEDEASWQKYSGQSFTASNLSTDTSYDLALRVQDEELVWSMPVIKTIEARNVPIGLTAKLKSANAQFTPQSIPITEELLLYDIQTTYPKALKLKVAFYKNENLIGTEKQIEFVEGDTGITIDDLFGHREWSAITHEINNTVADGTYTLKIEAIDVSNVSKKESIEFSVGVRTPINPVPTLEEIWITNQSTSMQCTSSIYTDELEVTLFKGTSQEETVQMTYDGIDAENEKKLWTLTYEVPEDISNALHTIEFTGVVHTTPHKRESKVETAQVVSLGFEEVILTGAWNHWRGQVDLFGEQLQDMPYRFLSWEKIFITAKTLGSPDRVTLELSPELQAMSFTDDNGKTFYYRDDFGTNVEFPLEFTKDSNNLWTLSYILPLADSTLSWENKRQREPYEITISAYKNGIKRDYKFNEANGTAIEITGNTSNLIYQQPVADY